MNTARGAFPAFLDCFGQFAFKKSRRLLLSPAPDPMIGEDR